MGGGMGGGWGGGGGGPGPESGSMLSDLAPPCSYTLEVYVQLSGTVFTLDAKNIEEFPSDAFW